LLWQIRGLQEEDAMPLNKSVRSKTSTRAKKSPRTKAKGGTVGAGVILIALMSVAVVAVLVAARESSDGPRIETDAQPQIGAEKSAATRSSASKFSAVVPMATPTTGVVMADDLDVDSAPAGPARKSPPVTVAGCLERTDNAFRLTETTGADAPKSRSWKSGFLKKGSASIDLVESGNGLKLRDHVGRRVSVTGALADRQMRVQSVRRVAAACS
jgi:hypothetical protein